ncbi:TonB-dependent receptor domain-containing protein [Flavobacterium chungbukense]|uniref:Outer membrane beta-barrel family protein n=1 Tax=Flavobacterium chungbukense TaxID=877464 RepID=A0ABP7YHK0_9FLAO|nr:TonB-dependent receptor [Flavobacterium chungbukense]MCC4920278.1 outer membrane beta-barrel family protein [Flavobacterium chungbukense]
MNLYLPLKVLIALLLFFLSLIANAQNEIPKDSISKELKEVVVTQNKKTFTNSNGNIKVDVANSVYSSVPNPVELLSKLPLVEISADRESISIVGKGNPLIYIDNQTVGMNDLNALSVADIKTIEIIQNPSSKYEAEGRAVILITRKLSKKDSFKTDISETASFKKNYNNYLGFNSNFKKGKIEWKANFNYNRRNPWENHSIAYQIPQESIVSDYNVTAVSNVKQYIFGGGLFYKINDEDYLSVTINGNLKSDVFDINTFTFNQNQNDENHVFTMSDNSSSKNFINSFVNYSRKIKAIDTKLFVGFQGSNFNQHLWSLVQNNYNETELQLSQNRDQRFNVDVFSGRIDLEKKFKNELNWEYGGLYSAAKSKSDYDVFDYEKNQNTAFDYYFKEANAAVYSQFSGKIKKVDFSVGLRVENTNVTGKYSTENVALVDKNYTNLFPKAQFSFSIDSTKSFSVDYSKSISRPNYSALSMIATYINPYFIYGSNINLGPTFADVVSATFQYHDKSVKLTLYQNKNPIYQDFVFDNQTNVLTFTEKNFQKESGYNVEFTLPFTYKFWTNTNSLIFATNKIEDESALFNSSKTYLYYYSNNTFKLPKEFTFVLSFWGATKQKEGVFERNAKLIFDMSLAKSFGKNWNCTLNYNDVFKNTIYTERFTINNISSRARYFVDANEVSITLRYSFGKIKESEFKEKSVNENESRIR